MGDDEYDMLYVDLHAKVARAPPAGPRTASHRELLDPVSLDTDFASYHSAVTADGATLAFGRRGPTSQRDVG